MSKFLKIDPVPGGEDPWSRRALASSVSPFRLSCSEGAVEASEAQEKAELKAKLGWRDPRGLKCYSKDGTYVDLYVYFDAKDKVSDLNVAATKAFKCYGLDGAQFAMDWDEIHGSAVVVREKPPMVGCSSSFGGPSSSLKQHSAPFNPLITADEMVDTLLFFKDKNAAKIAQRRDAQRTVGGGGMPPDMMMQMQGMMMSGGASRPSPFGSSSSGGSSSSAFPKGTAGYMGTGGFRDASKLMGKDREECFSCGKTRAMAGTLFACSQCVANSKEAPAKYCSRECQAADWKRHKKEDKCRKANKEQK